MSRITILQDNSEREILIDCLQSVWVIGVRVAAANIGGWPLVFKFDTKIKPCVLGKQKNCLIVPSGK